MNMTSRERVFAALDGRGPDRPPRDIWFRDFAQRYRAADWAAVAERFPLDFVRMPGVLAPSERARGEKGVIGVRVDDWGSVWRSLQTGLTGEVVRPALADWADLDRYRPPNEMLERAAGPAAAEVSKAASPEAAEACEAASRFRLGEVGSGPFELMQFLRGTENLYLDLAQPDERLGRLLDMVHEFLVRHCELWCRTDADGVAIGDDWGSQGAMLVNPDMWRRTFKPLYAEYFAMIRAAGKRVFFHTDGMTREIIPDLIEIGVDALNCEVSCMDIEELGRSFRDRVTFWGELCRQRFLPFGTPDEVRGEARRMCRALGSARGGFIAHLTWGTDVPTANILAAFEEWARAWGQ